MRLHITVADRTRRAVAQPGHAAVDSENGGYPPFVVALAIAQKFA